MERIQKQIKETYHKAFFDLLEQKVHQNLPIMIGFLNFILKLEINSPNY